MKDTYTLVARTQVRSAHSPVIHQRLNTDTTTLCGWSLDGGAHVMDGWYVIQSADADGTRACATCADTRRRQRMVAHVKGSAS